LNVRPTESPAFRFRVALALKGVVKPIVESPIRIVVPPDLLVLTPKNLS